MFSKQQTYTTIQQVHRPIYFAVVLCIIPLASLLAQERADSSAVLKKVTVKAYKKQNPYTSNTPVQVLDQDELQKINAPSIGDAAKYFSGVLIKDYGGIGGLKSISVRSLGASQTGLTYDGITVADAQSGQIDLSKFSTSFVQSIRLYQANADQLLSPARTYSSAALLAVTTSTFNPVNFNQKKWQVGSRMGSFGLWQPFAGIYLPTGKNIIISANAEYTTAKGDYPFYINNGVYSEKTTRINSDIRSLQAEVNVVKLFLDSSTLQTKISSYNSERGLPGSIIFFNDRSVQRLWNDDVFIQSRYQKKWNTETALLISGKYNYSHTRYLDPDYLNTAGKLDNYYNQQEFYLSAALSQAIGKNIIGSFASDIASTGLASNMQNFVTPTRTSLWNNLALQYSKDRWQLNASVLYTSIHDKTKTGAPAKDKNILSPFIAAGYKPGSESPFLFRVFYKNIFRMPSFNDIYYDIMSNASLKPEYAKQYDAGISYSKNFSGSVRQFNISVDGYYNTVKDKIIAVPSGNLFTWTMLNLGIVHIKGIDLATDITGKFSKQSGWSARIAYTFQQALDMTDPSAATYKNTIPYTPDHSGSGLVSFNYKKWTAGYSMLFSSYRYTLGENNSFNELDGWATQDVFVSKLISMKSFQINIKAELNNLSNQYYDVVKYFPMPGRSYKLSIILNNL